MDEMNPTSEQADLSAQPANPAQQTRSEEERRRRQGMFIGGLVGVLFLGVALYSLTLPSLDQAALLSIYATFGVAAAGFLALLLSFLRRTTAGGVLLVGMIVAASAGLQFVTRGQAGFIVVMMLVLVSALSSVTLTGRTARNVLVGAMLSAVLIVGLDYFLPATRPAGRADITAIVTIVLALLFAALTLRQFGAFRLQTKLVLASVLVSLVSALLVAGFSLYLTRQTLTENTRTTLLGAAENTGASLDQFIKATRETVQSESRLVILGDFLKARRETPGVPTQTVAQVLGNYARKDPIYIVAYSLVDASGEVVISTLPDDVGRRIPLRDVFENPVESGLPYVAPVRFDPIYDDSVMVFSAPVREAVDNEIVGVLMVAYRSAILQELVGHDTDLAGARSFGILVDERQMVLAHGGDPRLIARLVAPVLPGEVAALVADNRMPYPLPSPYHLDMPVLVEQLQSAAETPYFTADFTSPAEPVVVGASALLEQPWQILFVQPEQVANAPLDAQQRLLTFIAALAISLAVLLAVTMAAALSRPIYQLTETAEALTAGNLTARAEVRAQDEFGVLGRTFNAMAGQVQELVTSLEQRVAARTRALETSTEVSRRLSTILDQGQLVKAVVEEIQSAFDYYHAHIYLFDEEREYLRMAGGTGEAGRILLARHHAIRAGKGLVGRAAETNQVVLVPDVSQAIGWLPNDLLPQTKAEVAVPIAVGAQVVGVLDVQHNVTNGLGENDAALLQAIASQVAVALQNARSFERAQRQAERDALVIEIAQRIQQANTVEDVLRTTVQELGQALNAQKARVQLQVKADENGSRK